MTALTTHGEQFLDMDHPDRVASRPLLATPVTAVGPSVAGRGR
jgi:hypothetical protein